MILVSRIQVHCGGAMFSKCSSLLSLPEFITVTNPPTFSNPAPKFIPRRRSSTRPFHLTLAKAEGNLDSDSPSTSSSSPSPFATDQTVFVTGEDVPLEGVIQFEKPTSSPPFEKWGRVALLAGADVLALFVFATIGRYSHGLSVLDLETLRTADPFIAGWFLGAYFLGGFGEDGRGMNGLYKGVVATTKSWAVGIPIGIVIRAAASGHLPNYGFVLVSLGSTAVLLITFRALLYAILPVDNSKKSDDYRRGSPFELFELLTSLVRRW
ncbi:hypothetical protein AAZX31_14G089200 [Glycine max]|nr:uncharacterized protein LOC114385482 [Glycine soja]KAG4962552.1 hypothetical protein JHK86_039420 [Glycine max]KAG4953623.1 hypothetical protein JHK87_039217 [Glycine soja]KAG5110019.1 hypothetical protein JHK82_039242 [Glycine max]KAG5121308.1 hypothetical protein JHK84_039648 [Glycine max]RZB68218.1 hypothetical protein D0Y65_038141 [Glycine soja]